MPGHALVFTHVMHCSLCSQHAVVQCIHLLHLENAWAGSGIHTADCNDVLALKRDRSQTLVCGLDAKKKKNIARILGPPFQTQKIQGPPFSHKNYGSIP